jgi:hypothetical protein
MPKLKEFKITQYYKGIELNIMAVTTSRKKFAELASTQESYVKNYAFCNDPHTPECIANPEVLYAEKGMGGEVRHLENAEGVKTYAEMKILIEQHRKKYSDYRDFLAKTGNE